MAPSPSTPSSRAACLHLECLIVSSFRCLSLENMEEANDGTELLQQPNDG
ncbi:hypothetical protein SOVF_000580 [Spinacia oleracea]|nr:hypothetical protein SOVF_000580 [Spinacia oleracea]